MTKMKKKVLSVTLTEENQFLKSYRGSTALINYLVAKEFGRFGSDAEKIAGAAEIFDRLEFEAENSKANGVVENTPSEKNLEKEKQSSTSGLDKIENKDVKTTSKLTTDNVTALRSDEGKLDEQLDAEEDGWNVG